MRSRRWQCIRSCLRRRSQQRSPRSIDGGTRRTWITCAERGAAISAPFLGKLSVGPHREVRMFNAVNRLAVLITGIEVVVLVVWLGLTTSAAAAVAAGFLFIGILVEELVRFRGIKTRFPQGRELALVLLGVAGGTVGGVFPLLVDKRPVVGLWGFFFAPGILKALLKPCPTRKVSPWN